MRIIYASNSKSKGMISALRPRGIDMRGRPPRQSSPKLAQHKSSASQGHFSHLTSVGSGIDAFASPVVPNFRAGARERRTS
jgi:hypothetical protein